MDESEKEPLHSTSSEDEKQKVPKGRIVVFCIGLFLTILPIIMLAGGYTLMFNAIMTRAMEVEKGSTSYEMWKATPFPLTLNLYIWNITNHEEFVLGAKPDLEECGPYVYKEYHEKKEVSFHKNNTVTYFQQRWWVWNDTLSGNNTREDVIYTLNPVPLSAAWAVRHNSIYMALLNRVFNDVNETVIVKATVDELIFSGFEDPVLDWVQKNIIAENGTYHPLLPLINLPPGISNFVKFGWFYERNMSLSYDGIYNMMTGHDDIKKVGQIDWWNYTRATDFFDAPCNKVTGSTGEFFQPGLSRDKAVFYTSDLCMSMTLFYKEDVSRSGLKAYRFWGSNHTFANSSLVPGNECYCVKGTCAPMGLVNAESCRMGAPAFVSFPHYFNADPFLLDQVNGLSPDEKKHSFVMDIMPEAGIPINVNARMQINMRVKPYPGEGILHTKKIDILKDVPDLYLPMLWFEEFADVPTNMIKDLKTLQFIISSPTVVIVFSIILLFGLVLMAYAVAMTYYKKYQPEESIDDRFPQSI